MRTRDVMRQALGYAIAAACLVWVFHGIHGGRILAQVRDIRWGWVAVAVALDVLSYVCQGLRWRLLLRPAGDVSVLLATRAIYIGLLTNEVVPLRAGELVRAYLVSRWRGLALRSVVPSIAVERLFDGFWLAVGVGLAAIFVRLPGGLLRAADVFGFVIIVAASIFIAVVLRRGRRSELPAAPPDRPGPLRRLTALIGGLADGLRAIGTSRAVYVSFIVSPLIVLCQIVSFWLVMRAYGLGLSPWAGAAVFIIMYFGTALPNAPSNIGTYQFFTVLGLSLFGVDKTTAAGFSAAVFVILTAVLWIVGLAALARAGVGVAEIRRDIAALLARARR
jgi:uncharacterized protein (TIRG00374 family)